jgi:hypothetical protein
LTSMPGVEKRNRARAASLPKDHKNTSVFFYLRF